MLCVNKLAFMWELTGSIKQSAGLLCLIHSTLAVTFAIPIIFCCTTIALSLVMDIIEICQ